MTAIRRIAARTAAKFHSRWLVWSARTDGLRVDPEDEPAGWRPIDEHNVSLFADDPGRLRAFRAFMRQGHVGAVLSNGAEWLAYGWLATPTSGPPAHLPASTAGRHWIFYCRTAEEHRGRGHYRRAIVHLTREAARDAGRPTRVFIDTRDDNSPARRAIERLGFESAGVVHLFRVPRTSCSTGVWRRRASHPPTRSQEAAS